MKYNLFAAAFLSLCALVPAGSAVGLARADDPLPLVNTKSGISISLGGANGTDWAVEHCYHDRSIGDQVIGCAYNMMFLFYAVSDV